ncbi:hypothetical protein QBC32DRAFT_397424 [Pseudoneurospora amorphoporcata]|uniref:Uncharacterized protein n=1 Tax=Pseudoneurospora amorphoporcata TaxID=241081 RepID=A0AAN6NVY0_9PEZI|nr:hypothetical protein QBC32DRAFT_397424 [Pseudoneurospora amorphoporcata]
MFISKLLYFLSIFGLVVANTITFISLDEDARDIYSKHKLGCKEGDHGCEDLKILSVPGLANISLSLPRGWEGNFYSVPAGTPNRTGMLAEICSQGFENKSYFDVSAIDNPNDHMGVKQFWPANDQNAEVSGCITFPCDQTYYHPDDKQTKRPTQSEEFICTLGNADLSKHPHLAQYHMVYSEEHKKWRPMSAPSVPGADVSFLAVPGVPAVTRSTDAESSTATHTVVAEKTDATDEEDAADEGVTSVKKQTATPTLTAGHSHSLGDTVAAKHTASD